jgi:hypothetical protein
MSATAWLIRALSGCDTTSYPYGKGKISVADVLDEVGSTPVDLREAAKHVFIDHCTVKPASGDIHGVCPLHTLYQEEDHSKTHDATSNVQKSVDVDALRAHLQVMLWKTAYQQGPPDESADIITPFWWEIRDGIPVPVIF